MRYWDAVKNRFYAVTGKDGAINMQLTGSKVNERDIHIDSIDPGITMILLNNVETKADFIRLGMSTSTGVSDLTLFFRTGNLPAGSSDTNYNLDDAAPNVTGAFGRGKTSDDIKVYGSKMFSQITNNGTSTLSDIEVWVGEY